MSRRGKRATISEIAERLPSEPPHQFREAGIKRRDSLAKVEKS